MNCNAKQHNLCRLIQNSYKSPLLAFGGLDISADTFKLKIFKEKYSRNLIKEIAGEIDNENRAYFPEFILAKSDNYVYEILWNHQGRNYLVVFGKYEVKTKANDCGCGDKSDVINISVNDGDTVFLVSFSQTVLNVGGGGGPIDLVNYAKKDASNITVLSWQGALDIYTKAEAELKNELQDIAISENASNIQTLNVGLLNEVEARQTTDLELAQTISDLNGVVTTIKNWKEQMTTEDADSVVNTITEVLAVFQNVPEGSNIVEMFNQKLSLDSVVNSLSSFAINAPLSAYQGRVLSEMITALSNAFANHTHSYDSISGKPSVFPPSNHTHTWSEISGKPTEFAPPVATYTTLGGVRIWTGTVAEYNTINPKVNGVFYFTEKV